MDRETAVLTIINRLLASFPGTSSGSPDDALDGYLIGTRDIPPEFLADAAARFLAGSVPHQHMVFPPSPAQFATTAREIWYKAVDAAREEQLRLTPPAKDDVSDEEHARVKAGFSDLVAHLSAKLQTEDAMTDQRNRALLAKTNARFMPSMDPADMKRRLGFTVGDPDGDEAAA